MAIYDHETISEINRLKRELSKLKEQLEYEKQQRRDLSYRFNEELSALYKNSVKKSYNLILWNDDFFETIVTLKYSEDEIKEQDVLGIACRVCEENGITIYDLFYSIFPNACDADRAKFELVECPEIYSEKYKEIIKRARDFRDRNEL